MPIDWTNPKSKISKWFTVKDALFLRKWNRLANEGDGLNDHVKTQLKRIFNELDWVRELLGKPIIVTSAYRPQKYNIAIGGAKRSAHMCIEDYAAVDWVCDINGDGKMDVMDCDNIKQFLMSYLEERKLRMEDNRGGNWVHLDLRKVPKGGKRFFKP